MNFDTLFANMNRSVDTSAGYTHFQISRQTINALKQMASSNPDGLVKMLELCLKVRGEDKRRSRQT